MIFNNPKLKPFIFAGLGFVIGAIIIFILMSIFVVGSIQQQYQRLKTQLEDEPGNLLASAQQYFDKGIYIKAKEKLDILQEKYTQSDAWAKGLILMEEVETHLNKQEQEREYLDDKWARQEAAIKAQWITKRAAEIRDQLQLQRLKLDQKIVQIEQDLMQMLEAEWEREKAKIKEEWEKTLSP